MGLLPFDLMDQRLERARQDSDTSYFLDLLLFGELVTKAAVAALVGAVDDDQSRYQHLHRLVRADGVGEWGQVAEDVLTGPSAQHLLQAAGPMQRDLAQRLPAGTWQHDATALMRRCVAAVAPDLAPALPGTVAAKQWFSLFTVLRNKTRGHGALPGATMACLCPELERAIRLFADNALAFALPWAYLHRNLSGKYRVFTMGRDGDAFDAYKRSPPPDAIPNGVYIYCGRPVALELVSTDAACSDLFFANGAFTDHRFEMLSYVTGEKRDGESAKYLRPPGALPPSETDGLKTLEIVGNVFANIPCPPAEYISRPELERELLSCLNDDINRVVTLVGAGGIGKTSLTLTVLHQLARTERFSAMLWFSARDIDLLPDGPRVVQPQVLTVGAAAGEYVRLLQPSGWRSRGFDEVGAMSAALRKGAGEAPTLFVFDNFETVRSPAEMFAWLSEHARLPNKVLITTRHRDFRGDFPVPVHGMAEAEANALIDAHAQRLGIAAFVTDDYRRELVRESEGHPYVIKMLLGEVAKARRAVKVERIVASRNDVLPALFERTFGLLSPAAQRVFLTLASWRSNVPQVALEAVLLRQQNERIDVGGAVEELERYSFIEAERSEADASYFLSVPLAAAVFGARKLSVSPFKAAVEADRELLMGLGAGQGTDLRHGASARIEQLFRTIARRLAEGRGAPDEYIPVLEMIARQYPHAWLWLAKLHEELGEDDWVARSQAALRCFLETARRAEALSGWQRLADLCRRAGDISGEYHAWVELSAVAEASLATISNAASRINGILAANRMAFDQDQKLALRKVIAAFEAHVGEADSDDMSRLAWLHLQLHDEDTARRIVRKAIGVTPDNVHLQKLAARLRVSV